MSDLHQVLHLWQQIAAGSEDCVLATIVRVEGSSYRKPGARMLISKSGVRAGTISGGCLEAEVSKQAWWLTESGPVVKSYSTSFESDGDRPYGLGCGGTVHLLLERRQHAEPFLKILQCAFLNRQGLASAVRLEGVEIGRRCVVDAQNATDSRSDDALRLPAQNAWSQRESFTNGQSIWAEYVPPRTGLFIFGAGDDAKPLVIQAKTLGWYVAVADGRSHLATRARFPDADAMYVLRMDGIQDLSLLESDAAVVMTHSYQQDVQILKSLLPGKPAYVGVLGPRYRTADLLQEVALNLGRDIRQWEKKIHAPVGLDLGGDGPAAIALAILAEIQQTLGGPQARAVEMSRPEAVRQLV